MKRKLFTIILVLLAILGINGVYKKNKAVAATSIKLYLTPNSNWVQADARFAIYYWLDASNGWVDMEKVEGHESMYEAIIPDTKYINIIFCRMDPSKAENDWANKWDQTNDLVIPTNGNNNYTIAEGTWSEKDGNPGSWSRVPTVIFWNSYPIDDGTYAAKFEPVLNNESFVVPANPIYPGYKFLGWNNGKAERQTFKAGDTVTFNGDEAYYAQWEPITTITITYIVSETRSQQASAEKGTVVADLIMPEEFKKANSRIEYYKDEELTDQYLASDILNVDTTIYLKYIEQVTIKTVNADGTEKSITADYIDGWEANIAANSPKSYTVDGKKYCYAGVMLTNSNMAETVYFLEFETKSSLRINAVDGNFASADIRFGAYVNKDEYQKLFTNMNALEITFGVKLSVNGHETMVDCENIGLISNSHYQYAALITNIDKNMYDNIIIANCYIKNSSGEVIYESPTVAEYSVKSLAEKYISTRSSSLTEEQIAWLNAILEL